MSPDSDSEMEQRRRRIAVLKLVLKMLMAVALPLCIPAGEFPVWFDVWLIFIAVYLGVTAVREYREQTWKDRVE